VFLPRDFIRLERLPRERERQAAPQMRSTSLRGWHARPQPRSVRARRASRGASAPFAEAPDADFPVTQEPPRAMSSWKARRSGQRRLIHLIAWLARTSAGPCAARLLVPIVLYFVVTDGTARRASREFLRSPKDVRRAGAEVFATSTASPRRCSIASGWPRGDFDRFDVTVDGDPLVRRRWSRARAACCSARTSAAST
jgi:hypothetical protein